MKKVNLNNYVYIQIPERGWEHLRKIRNPSFIEHCVKAKKEIIEGEEWYKIQIHEVFRLFPITSSLCLFETTMMFEDRSLVDVP